MSNSLIKRGRLFDLVFDHDPVLTEADLHLRAADHIDLAEALLKLQQDIGTEQMDDTHGTDIRDFSDVSNVDRVARDIKDSEKPDWNSIEGDHGRLYIAPDDLVKNHSIVTEERFSILEDIHRTLQDDKNPLADQMAVIVDEYHKILLAFAPASPQPNQPGFDRG